MANMGETITYTALGVDALSGPFGAAGKAMGGLGAAAGLAGKAIGVAMTAATVAVTGFAAAAAAGVKSAGDLQQSVANISTIKPEIDTTQVFDSLNQMSTRIPQTAAELGDSLYDIFSSVNVTQAEGIALLEKFGRGAVGAQTDAKTFGTAIMGIMNAYGLSVSDADHISDVFFNTVNKGVVTGSELASSLGLVTQAAKLAGADVNELGGMIAGVTREGGPAAQNINNLNNMLLKIPSKQATKAFAELGIAVANEDGTMRSVTDVMQDLKDKTAGMTEEARNLAVQKVFPDMQAKAGAMVLMSQLDFVKETIQDNVTASGTASKAFETMNATFNSQLKILMNTFQSILTTVGAKLLPIITPLISAFSKWLPDAFDRAMKSLEPWVPSLQGLGTVAMNLGKYIMALVETGDYMNDLLVDLPRPLRDVIVTLGQFGQVAVETAAQLLGLELDDYNAGWGQLGAIVTRTSELVVTGASKIVEVVKQAMPLVTGLIQAVFPVVVQLATAVADRLSGAFAFLTEKVLPPVLSIFQQTVAFVQTIAPVFSNTSAVMRDIFGETLAWLAKDVWPSFLSIVQYVVAFFNNEMLPRLPAIATALRTTLGETIQWIATTVMPALQVAAKMAWDFFTETIVPAIPGVARTIRDLLGGAIEWIGKTGWPMFVEYGGKAKDWILGTAVPAIMSLVDWLGPKIAAAAQWVYETGWPTLVSVGQSVTGWILDTAVPAIMSLVDWLGPKVSGVVKWLTDVGWPYLVEAAKSVSDWIMGPGAEAFSSLVDWLGPKVSAVVTWLMETGWPTLVTAATAVTDWIVNTAVPKLTELWSWLEEKTRPIIRWMIDDGWPMLVEAAKGFSDWMTETAIPKLQELWSWLEEKTRPAVAWLTTEGWPKLKEAGQFVLDMFKGMAEWAASFWEKIQQTRALTDLSEALDKIWDAGKTLVEVFWPGMVGDENSGAKGAFTATDVFVKLVEVGAAGVNTFASAVKLVADGFKALKDALSGLPALPDWFRKILEMSGVPGAAAAAVLPRAGAVPTGAAGGPIDNSSRASFVRTSFPALLQAAGGNKDLAEMMAAAAISENGAVGKGGDFQGNNFFGIKGKGPAGSFIARTWEMVNGQRVYQDAEFAAYNNPVEGFQGFLDFLRRNPLYKDALAKYEQSGDATQLFKDINSVGYATDPNWASTVANIRRNQVAPVTANLDAASMVGQQTNLSGQISGPVDMTKFDVGNQFEMGLPWDQAAAACGPAAAMLFLQATGRTPNAQEVMQIAAKNGWTQGAGMGGFGAFQGMLGDLGIQYSLRGTTGQDAINSAMEGGLTGISTSGGNVPLDAGHYFVAQGFDPTTGKFDLGETGGGPGNALKGGSRFMTVAEIEALAGPIKGVVHVASQIGPTFATATDEAGTALGGLGRTLLSNQEGTKSLTDEIIANAASQGIATGAVGNYNAGLINQQQALQSVLAGYANTNPAVASLLSQLEHGTITVDEASRKFAALATTTATSAGEMTTAASGMAKGVVDQFGIAFDAAATKSADMTDDAIVHFDAMRDTSLISVTDMGKGVLTTVQDMSGDTIATVTDMTGKVTDQSATLANGVTLNINDMGVKSTTAVDEMMGTITTTMTDEAGNSVLTISDMTGKVTGQFATMQTKAGSSVAQMANVSKTEFGNVVTAAGGIPPKIAEVNTAYQNIKTPNLRPAVSQWEAAEQAAEDARKAAEDYAHYAGTIFAGSSLPFFGDRSSRGNGVIVSNRSSSEGSGRLDGDAVAKAIVNGIGPIIAGTRPINLIGTAEELKRQTQRMLDEEADDRNSLRGLR